MLSNNLKQLSTPSESTKSVCDPITVSNLTFINSKAKMSDPSDWQSQLSKVSNSINPKGVTDFPKQSLHISYSIVTVSISSGSKRTLDEINHSNRIYERIEKLEKEVENQIEKIMNKYKKKNTKAVNNKNKNNSVGDSRTSGSKNNSSVKDTMRNDLELQKFLLLQDDLEFIQSIEDNDEDLFDGKQVIMYDQKIPVDLSYPLDLSDIDGSCVSLSELFKYHPLFF